MKKPPYVFLLVVVIVAVGVALIRWFSRDASPATAEVQPASRRGKREPPAPFLDRAGKWCGPKPEGLTGF
jgi:hypothetical protein